MVSPSALEAVEFLLSLIALRTSIVVQFVFLVNVPQKFSGIWVVGVWFGPYDLLHKLCSDLAAV